MLFELITLAIFVGSLLIGAPQLARLFILGTPVLILFAIVLIVGLLVPLLLHWRPTLAGGMRTAATLSAVLVLIGGFVLRWAVLAAPQGVGL
jgi:formate-dependent nitrite reductase membrane component NrfD